MEELRPAGAVSALAPGKINLCFQVGDPRKDGTRGVATAYQAVSIYDTVTVSASDSFKVTQLGLTGFGKVSPPERNLALRAAKHLAQKYGIKEAVRLDVDKQIPKGAGMSGGSADAAAALVACNEYWNLGLGLADLKQVALELGADVSFSLEGGTAIGTGHGDEFNQLMSRGKFSWVVAPLGPRLEEDDVLRVLDERRSRTGVNKPPVLQPQIDQEVFHAVRSGNPFQLAEVISNDLQEDAFFLARDIAAVCTRALELGALQCVMLAMGPAMAFLAESRDQAHELREDLTAEGCTTIVVEGPVRGAHLQKEEYS